MKIRISNDDELTQLLEDVYSEVLPIDNLEIEFHNYPRYGITLRGEDFDGGIPTRVLPSIMKFQKAIYSSYSMLKYGDDRKLNKEELLEVEVIVKFNADKSTTVEADATAIVNNVLMKAFDKMNGTESLIAILTTVTLIAGFFSYKAYLNSKDKNKQIELSKEETRRLEIVTKVLDNSEILTKQAENFTNVINNFASKLSDGDKIVLPDDTELSSEEIKKSIRKKREPAVETRLDGYFIILSVDSGIIENGFKIKVQQNIENGKIINVDAPDGTLSKDQIEILKNGEWGKNSVYMQINANKSGDRIYKAVLVEAGLHQPK